MLVHLWLDRIVLFSSLGQTILPLRGIDSSLPEALISLYQQIKPDKIYVITWPGSFTHVRIGVLALETLSLLSWGVYHVLQTEKVSLYRSLANLHLIPSTVSMYIGQRKNLWLYDFSHDDTHSVVTMEHLVEQNMDDYAIDSMVGEDILVSEQIAHHTLWRVRKDAAPCLTYCDTVVDCSSFFTVTESLTPYYLVDPTIG